MPLVVLLGGVRSGKSRLAVDLALRRGAPVIFLATAEARDAEMASRIARHRRERPAAWETVEAPPDLVHALAAVPPGHTLVVDCLSLWVAGLLERGADETSILASADAAAATAAGRAALTVSVTNEVGMGVVPASPLGRAFRDLLGGVNARWVARAERAALVVAGRPLVLDPGEPLSLLDPAVP